MEDGMAAERGKLEKGKRSEMTARTKIDRKKAE